MTARKISLKVVAATSSGLVLDAPPILKEVDQSVDYICGHAERSCCTRRRTEFTAS